MVNETCCDQIGWRVALRLSLLSGVAAKLDVTTSRGTLHRCDVKLNGVSVPEAALNAAIAGHFGVPVAMISGDDAIVDEAHSLLGDIEGAIVKWNYGESAARTLMPEAAFKLIREKVERALGRLGDFKSYVLEKPVRVDMSFSTALPAETLAFLPSIERTGSHSIRFIAEDMGRRVQVLRVRVALPSRIVVVSRCNKKTYRSNISGTRHRGTTYYLSRSKTSHVEPPADPAKNDRAGLSHLVGPRGRGTARLRNYPGDREAQGLEGLVSHARAKKFLPATRGSK